MKRFFHPNQSVRQLAKFSHSNLFAMVAIVGSVTTCLAQEPTSPATSQPATTSKSQEDTSATSTRQQTPQAQADVEWLTAYMLAHEGYRLNHLPALEQSFEKMSPTQLHTLRELYEQKRAMAMRQAAIDHRLQEQQLELARQYHERQQRTMDQAAQQRSQAVNEVQQQINRMHADAAANAAAQRLYGPRIYPSPILGGRPYGWSRYPY